MEGTLSSAHIEKLGHKILEIRERALFNIMSKLENGILLNDDLARNKELLTKLFQWFLFEPCTRKRAVFSLLKHILKSQNARTLINHYGKSSLKVQINQMRLYLEPEYYTELDELCEIINEKDEEPEVPPLETDIALSYRSNSTRNNCPLSSVVGTTATAIEGYIQKESFVEQQTGIGRWPEISSSNNSSDDGSTIKNFSIKKNATFIPNFYLNWQPLVEPDRHVLQSVETSLKDPPQSSALLSSCEFFTNILLHDFPAEVFLQRPAIVLELQHLLTLGSVRLTNAILNALCSLTKLLQTRIHYCNDMSLRNIKNEVLCRSCSVHNSPRDERNYEFLDSQKFENLEDILVMQKNQLSFPKYCFTTLAKVFDYLCVKREFGDNKFKLNQTEIISCLILLEEIVSLLCLCFEKDIWNSEQNERVSDVLTEFSEIFIRYSEALEYFRVESIVSESNGLCKMIYFYIIHNIAMLLQRLVPSSRASVILPRNLKTALSNCLLDVILGRLYPEVHVILLDYVKSCGIGSDIDFFGKYQQVSDVCNGLSATVLFLKRHRYLSICESIEAARAALPSVEYHMNFDFLNIFVSMCSSKLCQVSGDPKMTAMAEEIVLSLLSHDVMEVKEEMYRLCHRTIVTHIGPEARIDSSGSQILFLLFPKVLIDIAVFGMTSRHPKVALYAEEIVLYIIKCQAIVPEVVWNKIIQALIPSLPILVCHVKKNSATGKALMTLLDPDKIMENFIPSIVMLKCNVELLFSKEAYLRDEAFSRICWLLTSQENSRELLPKFNAVYDKALANVCYLKTVADINKSRFTDHFYQPTSLCQVMEVVNSDKVEPVLKRSALNQVSVMVEDPLLHAAFLERNGITLVMDVMKSALAEQDYKNYPDSVVPIMAILKNICLYHADVREELSVDMEVFYCVLRGLFLFFAEERVRQEAGTLLCLLIFKDFVRGTPANASFSLPDLIRLGLHLPFSCNGHWNISDFSKTSTKDAIIFDQWCLSSIQIQWNLEIFGSFEELIKCDDINYGQVEFDFSKELILSSTDLRALKTSCIYFCIRKYLNSIQNGTDHSSVIESIENLIICICLYKTSRNKNTDDGYFLSQPWERTLAKFLKSLPSCKDDVLLLGNVLRLLTALVPLYKLSDGECWISAMLKDDSQCLLDLLTIDSTAEESKLIGQELLKLITVCVCREQHYLDFYTARLMANFKPWTNVIKIIADILKFNNSQHFYNLAYLNFLLLCLVHLTATLGWSICKPAKETTPNLISNLCELIGAFHCGKGSSATVSVMGLSITRHVLLILNNLVAELQHSKSKFWERYFLDDHGEKFFKNFPTLWGSRDVVVRAGALQLFAGLAACPQVAVEVIRDVRLECGSILNAVFAILVDNQEANIAREYAAQLVANLVAHMTPLTPDKGSHLNTAFSLKRNYTEELLNLLEKFCVYGNLELTLNSLFTTNNSGNAWVCRNTQESSNNSLGSLQNDSTYNSEGALIATTPGLLKGYSLFLYNILNIAPEHVTKKLEERGLIKLLYRSLCNPSMSVSNLKELSLYCDILEMDMAVCSDLIKLATISASCLGTLLHTRDCFSVLISLLNYKNFQVDTPQLLYLRNDLWTKIFQLLTVLIEYAGRNESEQYEKSVQVLTIFEEMIFESRSRSFLETVCESISCLGSNGLQNSALTFLSSLLKTDFYRTCRNPSNILKTNSVQNVLDLVRMSRSVVCSMTDETCEKKHEKSTTEQSATRNNSRYKSNLLEEAYFGRVLSNLGKEVSGGTEISFVENTDGPTGGFELCKILLHLYEISTLKKCEDLGKTKVNVMAALASLLCVSHEAKKCALENGLLHKLMKRLRELYIQLSLESVECFRRITNKRNAYPPVLNDLNNLVRLLTNFIINNETAKAEAATSNLADLIHKLWVWFSTKSSHLIDILRLLNVYSADCSLGCQSMTLTSSVAGSGPRKVPTNDSLLHTLIALVIKQMDQFSKTRDPNILKTLFSILSNCCCSLECRILIAKSTLFNGMLHLHPAKTKKQKPWDSLELMWLDFLQHFTRYPEGQTSVAKAADILELVMTLAFSPGRQHKLTALLVLRNVSFYQPNRTRLLSLGEFLNILQAKLGSGTCEEKNTVVTIMWALAANSQKAKKALKSARLDVALDEAVKQYRLLKHETTSSDLDLNRINVVFSLLQRSQ